MNGSEVDIDLTGSALNFDTTGDINVITTGSVNIGRSLQNAGTGNVNVIAGWDGASGFPTGVDLTFACDPLVEAFDGNLTFNDCDTFATAGETVTIGSASQTASVAVGSRSGTTTILGQGFTLTGSTSTDDAFSQVGFFSDGSGDSRRQKPWRIATLGS